MSFQVCGRCFMTTTVPRKRNELSL
jgi:hypothetical protein